MAPQADWRQIVASALNWDQAHATLDAAIEGLPPDMRGRRPNSFPHSVWELLDHIRRVQYDLLDFCRNPHYEDILKFPDDYWPPTPAPPSDAAWNDAVAAIHRDRADLATLTMEDGRDLTAKIPHGTGQTYLRTVLVAVDHTSYHVGQIIAVRRLIGAWSAS
jgi:uncharacterized damage-inducible protein DinB